MKYDEIFKQVLFEKTNGRCAYCHKTLSFDNHGVYGARGAWQIDHSLARANGGSDHVNNLFPACIQCNQMKSAISSRHFRALTHPLRKQKRNRRILREIEKYALILTGLLLYVIWRFKQWKEEKQNKVFPWDAVIAIGIVLIILVSIFSSHSSKV